MTAFNNYKTVTLQNLVDDPDCSEEDVAQWVQDNSDKFEDDSNPGEFSQDKVNKLFGDLVQNNAFGSFGNLGIDCTSGIDWFNLAGEQDKDNNAEKGLDFSGSILSWGKQLLGLPGTNAEKKPINSTSGGFGMGNIDLGSLIKKTSNPQLKKVLWVLDTVFKEIKKRWSSMRKTTSGRTTAKKTTSRSRTTTARTTTAKKAVAKKTTTRTTTAKKATSSRSTTAKKTAAKKTPSRNTTAKKTTAKKTTTSSTTAKKTR